MKLPVADYSRKPEPLTPLNDKYSRMTTEIRVQGTRDALSHQLQSIRKTESDLINHHRTMNKITHDKINHDLQMKQYDRQQKGILINAALDMAQKGISAYAAYKADQAKEQSALGDNSFKSKVNEVGTWITENPKVDATTLPEGVLPEGFETTITDQYGNVSNKMVNTQEYAPEIIRARQLEIAKEVSQTIENPKVRAQWLQMKEAEISGVYGQNAENRAKTAKAQQQKNLTAELKVLHSKGEYDSMNTLLATDLLPEDNKIYWKNEIARGSELATISQTLLSKDKVSLQGMINHYSNPDVETNFKPEEVLTMVSQMETAHEKLVRGEVAEGMAYTKMMEKEVSFMADKLIEGHPVSPLVVGDTWNRIKDNPNIDPYIKEEFRQVMVEQRALTAFSDMPSHTRGGLIDGYEKAYLDTGSKESYTRWQMYKKRHDYIESAYKDDEVGAISKLGHNDISPLAFGKENTTLDASIKQRQLDITASEISTARKFTNILTKPEAAIFTEQYHGLKTHTEKVGFIDDIYNRFDEETSNKIIDQLAGVDPEIKMVSIAGRDMAIEALDGKQILPKFPKAPANTKEFDLEFDDLIGDRFTENPDLYINYREMARNIYAARAWKHRDGILGDFDSKILDSVIEDLPFIEIDRPGFMGMGGSTQIYIPPKPGVSTEMFIQDVHSIPAHAFSLWPRKVGETDQQVKARFITQFTNGSITFEQDGRNTFVPIDSKGYQIMLEHPTDPRKTIEWTYSYGKSNWAFVEPVVEEPDVIQPAPIIIEGGPQLN